MTFESASIEYRIHDASDALPHGVQALFSIARKNLAKSYAPYSAFTVAAATRSEKGKVFAGANQENGAYPMCLCAERVTLSNAIHLPEDDRLEVFVIAGGALEKMETDFLTPCGACRQVLVETENRQQHPIRLFLEGKNGKILEFKNCSVLLPFGFVFQKNT